MQLKLWEYQEKAVKFMLERACGALFLEMGLGKSSITLSAISILKQQKLIGKTLIVAPLRVAQNVWKQEVEKWDELSHLRVGIMHGKDKLDVLNGDYDIYVTNYESLKWLQMETQKREFPFSVLVLDELSKCKSTATQRFKTLKKMLPKFHRRYGLTGTPAANGLLDLFGQMYALDTGATFGPYITAYKATYFQQTGFGGYDWVLKPGAEDEIHAKLKPRALQMSAADYLELPDLVKVNIKVQLPDAAKVQYLSMEKKLKLEIDEGKVTAANAAVAIGKCIAEGTEVLTNAGWLPIEQFTPDLCVWDGLEWVSADKLQFNGVQTVETCYNIQMTSAHKVLTTMGWRTAGDIINGKSGKEYAAFNFRLPNGDWARRKYKTKLWKQASSLECAVQMWKNIHSQRGLVAGSKEAKREKLWLHARAAYGQSTWYARHVYNKTVQYMACYARALPKSKKQGLAKLWRAWYNCKQRVAKICTILVRYAGDISAAFDFRQDRQYAGVLKSQLPMGNAYTASKQPPQYQAGANKQGPNTISRGGAVLTSKVPDTLQASYPKPTARVYDIINAGPRSRFTVRDHEGQALLVHNCRQIASGNIYGTDDNTQVRTVHHVHSAKLEALDDLVEELAGNSLIVFYEYQHEADAINAHFGGKVPTLAGGMSESQAAKVLSAWNNGETQMLLAQSAAAALGLNLQKGGNNICWYTLTYSLDTYLQANARLHRQGQAKPVFVYHILAEKTVDYAVLSIINKKDKQQTSLLAALGEYWK